MITTLLAHAGEHHETAAEAAKHADGFTISTPLIFWLVLLLVPAVLYLALHALRVKLPHKLLAVSVFLIVFSVVSYQNPGIYSAVALAIGFGLVFLLSIAGLSSNEQ